MAMMNEVPRAAAIGRYGVVIAGAGPSGLMLAGELALAGIAVALVERRASQALTGFRAGGLHARTIEIFDQRGIAERFLAEGQTAQVAGFAGVSLDIGDFPTRHNYGLALRQHHIERILAGWVEELSVPIYRGVDVTDFAEHDAGIDVALSDGRMLQAQYLAGCDGGRSPVRKAAAIDFPGSDPTVSNLLAEAELTGEPEWGIRRDANGMHALNRLEESERVGIMVTEREVGRGGEPTLAELSEAMIAAYGTDYGVHSPVWMSRFTDMTRQAASYRKGRILLVGDAAHVHPPDGGQGLQTGVQDAMNLGWKLAQVVKGVSPDSLLDSYHAERHPVGVRVLEGTMASVALRRDDERGKALRAMIAELLGMDEPRRHLAARFSGLDVRYDFGEGHPLTGRRMPDLDLVTANGSLRLYTLLHDARPLLLNLGAPGSLDIAPWADRVRLVEAAYVGAWELPAIGAVCAPVAVLIRPDGHVAWVGEGSGGGLVEALTRWFGAAGMVSAAVPDV